MYICRWYMYVCVNFPYMYMYRVEGHGLIVVWWAFPGQASAAVGGCLLAPERTQQVLQ